MSPSAGPGAGHPWDAEEPLSRAPSGGQTTSRAAVAAGLFSCLFPVGIGGLLGIALGILGLRQIAASGGALAGRSMAWLGIILGVAQLILAGALLQRLADDLDQAPGAAATFFENLSAGKPMEAAPVMASGLRPAMDRGGGAEIAKSLAEALGEFQGLGERVSYSFHREDLAEALVIEYALKYSKGAPAWAKCTLVRQDGAMRLRAFSVRSPVLHKPIGATAVAGRELSDFQGPKAPARALKEYRPGR